MIHDIVHPFDRNLSTPTFTNDAKVVFARQHVAEPHCQCYAACKLIGVEVCVSRWEERQEDLIEHASLDQPAQICDDECVLVLPEAIVHLETLGSG